MSSTGELTRAVLAELEAAGSPEARAQLEPRYGIVTPRAWGVSMRDVRRISKPHRGDRAMAAALWESGWYEARLVCAFIEDPDRISPEEMDRWRADFDNWAVTDALCMHLFDRTPHALARIDAWAGLAQEQGRRAAFALLASVALHRRASDAELLARLRLIEDASGDERNFVKKGVSWALRAIGRRPDLRGPTAELAQRLAGSRDRTARWIGNDALRDFARFERPAR